MLVSRLSLRSFRSLYCNKQCHRHGKMYFHTTPVLCTDYYKLLGVDRNVSHKRVKAAYFGLAKKCHPDVCNDEESRAMFEKISTAYQVLSCDASRREYDISRGDQQFKYTKQSTAANSREENQNIFKDLFGDNFDDLLAGKIGYRTGRDNQLDYTVGVSMKEAALGCEKYFEINTDVECGACTGSGIEGGACTGSGIEGGDESCVVCEGTGRLPRTEWHPVTIPPGIEDEQILTIPGIERGTNFTITLRIAPDHLSDFSYDEDGYVHTDVTILYSSAVQGDTVAVSTLFGEDELVIPAGTQPGTKLELLTQGPLHTYTVHIHVPTLDTLTPDEIKHLRSIYNEEERNNIHDVWKRTVCGVVHIEPPTKTTLFMKDLYNATVGKFMGRKS